MILQRQQIAVSDGINNMKLELLTFCVYVYAQLLSCIQLFATPLRPLCNPFVTPWSAAHQGSSVHGIFQARPLEWVAISYSRGSSDPGVEHTSLDSPVLAGRFSTIAPPGKPLLTFCYKDMATHSSILAWRIPWTEEPGRLLSMGSQESDTT